MNHKALDTTHVSQPYAYTLAPPRMTFTPLTVALAAKLFFDRAVRLQCFAPKIHETGIFGLVCNPLSPRPDIGRPMSSSRQRWHVVPAEGPRLLQVTAVRTVLGGAPSLHPPPPPPYCAPSSMKWEPLCPTLYTTPCACWAGAGLVGSPAAPGSCAGVGPGGGHTTAAVAAGPSITPGSRSGRSMFSTSLSISLSLRFSLCLAKN